MENTTRKEMFEKLSNQEKNHYKKISNTLDDFTAERNKALESLDKLIDKMNESVEKYDKEYSNNVKQLRKAFDSIKNIESNGGERMNELTVELTKMYSNFEELCNDTMENNERAFSIVS